MASTIYNGTTSQTTTYAASDIYTLAVPTSSITNVSQQGANVVIQTGATSFTIAGVTLAQLANANFAIQGGGAIQFGDGTSNTTADQFGDNINFSTNNNGTVVLGLGGPDTIQAGNGANLIYGGSGVTDPTDGGDQITTGTGNDTIYGNGGNDLINSNGGTDIVFGGVGLDTINTGALTGNVSVYGGGGFTDTTDGADSITVASNAGNLFLTGNAGNDTIVLTASTGSASVYGGIGADTITAAVSAGNNLFAGGSATGTTDVDTINITASGTANVTVFGGVGITDTVDGADNITVTGLAAGSNAFVYGNAGNDTISVGSAGAVSVYGGVGTDLITLSAVAGNPTTGRAQIFAGGADGTGADTVDASAYTGNTTIFGGTGLNDSADGADRLLGGAGNDVIYGNGGADTIFSGAGNDQLSGGAGNDSFVIDGTGNKAISDFGVGTDSLFLQVGNIGGVTGVTASSTGVQITTATGPTNISVSGTIPTTFSAVLDQGTIGVVEAGDGQLLVATTSAGASLIGTANADYIQGNAGADNIVAGNGANTVFGGAGNDTIVAGTGVDVITGGTGNDNLTGGTGADRFVFESTGAANGVDTFTDIAAGAGGDILDFSAFAIDGNTAVNTPGAIGAVLSANPGASSDVAGTIVRLTDIAAGQDITTAAGLQTAVAAGGEYANIDMAANSKAIFVTSATNGADVDYYFLATSDAAGAISIVQVGVTTNNVDIDDYTTANFAI